MELTIGFSPCPNDTFIFDAMVHQKVDTEGLSFKVHMADVEELNSLAFQNKLQITKLSFHAFLFLVKDYVLLNSGSALGKGVGPLLISKKTMDTDELSKMMVGIPGKFTTANLLLSLAYPEIKLKKEMLFSDIEDALIAEKIDLGLIIHENRFTYKEKGLKKIRDLGEFWEEKSAEIIPLGGIVCKRSLNKEIQLKVDRIIRRSIEFARENPEKVQGFIQENAQEMSKDVLKKHIDLYVNEYSISLGTQGRKAVDSLFAMAEQSKLIKKNNYKIYID